MLLPLLLNNLMGRRPTPPAPTQIPDGVRQARKEKSEARIRLEREDEEIFEILKTFITQWH